jgi:hypothetical protein
MNVKISKYKEILQEDALMQVSLLWDTLVELKILKLHSEIMLLIQLKESKLVMDSLLRLI